MAMRFGFGEQTGVSEEGGLKQYENGHVDVSRDAFQHVIETYPSLPPAGAIGMALLVDVANVDLSDHADAPAPEIDWEAVHAAVQSVEGVGEAKADEITDTLQAAVSSEGDV